MNKSILVCVFVGIVLGCLVGESSAKKRFSVLPQSQSGLANSIEKYRERQFEKARAEKIRLNSQTAEISPTPVSAGNETCNSTLPKLPCVSDAELIYWGWELNNLGYYKECMRNQTANNRKYCVMQVVVTNYTILDPTQVNILGAIGACVQANCSDLDMDYVGTYVFRKYIQQRIQPWLPDLPEGTEYIVAADCNSFQKPPVDSLTVFVMVLLACLASFLVLGTLVDMFEQMRSEERTLLIQHGEDAKNNGHGSRARYSFPVRVVFNFLRAFSAIHNFQRLLVPVPGATANLNGMRTISMAWIIMGHSLYVALEVLGYLNHPTFIDIVSSVDYMFVIPAIYAVDSFFWLSGFLVTFILVKQLRKMQARARDGAPMSGARKAAFWFMFYFHRYYRLTPVYFVIILIWWRLVPQIGEGPVWSRVDTVQNECDKYWWTNILYINNLHPEMMLDECMGWSWYLANDFQFYIITPIICLVWIRSTKLGYLLCLLILIGSVTSTVLMSHHDLKNRSTDIMTGQPFNTYVKPWVRIPPYLFGLLSAFFLHSVAPNGVEDFRQATFEPGSGGRSTQNFLKSTPKRWFLYFIATCLMISGMFLDWFQIKAHNNGDTWDIGYITAQCVYMRLCWGIGLTLIFVPWILGWGGIANRFLSHNFWTAGARLTYTAYLLHPLLMTVYFGSRYNGVEFSRQWLLYNFLGFLVASYGLAGVFYLLVEKPMMNLEKYILPSGH